ncbi:TetR/AcrR family transcriptional regulator [Actinocatenispora rupis]|uniref:TetR family transcriptional regulator n=1 Tax=Actinocatenispora rupis TaxID=519421 RepID=A0A8J3IZQ0_9ACTN|nr:TetR/AcrR family transcriptional regulator [Actinocatenispora rupis]GID13061.1 TetR family transcriptional regulator [Actinocatenispora rupis]
MGTEQNRSGDRQEPADGRRAGGERVPRAETQRRNRARVLAAARHEFTERGFRDAKIDRIAERAKLTRGAVYSNFPGKRALYFSVLAEDAEQAPADPRPGRTVPDALAALASAWLSPLPLATDGPDWLGRDLVPEILADEHTRRPYAELLALQAIALGFGLEALPPRRGHRLVRVAAAALTTLHGAGQLAVAAPGFADPFDVVETCRGLAGLDLADDWSPPHAGYAPAARPVDAPWAPPAAVDALRAEPVRPGGDGVVAVLGLHRLSAVEEALRLCPVTAVLVTGEPRELDPLVRLVLAELRSCLRHALPESAWPRLSLVHDGAAAVAAAAGVRAVSDETETAVRVRDGRIVARADGRGACHAAASVPD